MMKAWSCNQDYHFQSEAPSSQKYLIADVKHRGLGDVYIYLHFLKLSWVFALQETLSIIFIICPKWTMVTFFWFFTFPLSFFTAFRWNLQERFGNTFLTVFLVSMSWYRYAITKAFCIAFVLTFFSMFDVPVFWPILLCYWMVLFVLTMRRQISHMIKYKYVPFNIGKQVKHPLPLFFPFFAIVHLCKCFNRDWRNFV